MLDSMNKTSRFLAIAALVLGAYGWGASAARADLKSVLEHEKETEQAGDPGVTPEPAESPRLLARFHRVDPAELAFALAQYRALAEVRNSEWESVLRSPVGPDANRAIAGNDSRTQRDPRHPPLTLRQALWRVYEALDVSFPNSAAWEAIRLRFPDGPPLLLGDLLGWVGTVAMDSDYLYLPRRERIDPPAGRSELAPLSPGSPVAPPAPQLPRPETVNAERLPRPSSALNGAELDSSDRDALNGRAPQDRRLRNDRNRPEISMTLRRLVYWASASRQKRSEIPAAYGDPRVQHALAELAQSLDY